MSSILKALEKAEESQSVRRDGGAGGFKKPRERRSPWVLPIAVLGGAAFAALATFAAMGGFSRSAAPVAKVDAVTAPPKAEVAAPPRQVVVPPDIRPVDAASAAPQGIAGAAATETVSVPPPEPAPVSKPDMDAVAKRVTGGAGRVVRATPAHLAAASAAPAHASAKDGRQQSAQPRVLSASAQPAAMKSVAASAARQQGAQAPVQAVAAQPAAVPKLAAPAVQTAAIDAASPVKTAKARPEIRVTGIAWQKDSASSGAIVNGRMVQQGGVVDGYKIEQILEEKVIFSGSGGKLEVPLSAGE